MRKLIFFSLLLAISIGTIILLAKSSIPTRASAFIGKHTVGAPGDATRTKIEWDDLQRRAKEQQPNGGK